MGPLPSRAQQHGQRGPARSSSASELRDVRTEIAALKAELRLQYPG